MRETTIWRPTVGHAMSAASAPPGDDSIESATATPRSPVSVQVSMRGLSIIQDKPARLGGSDAGPMASELLLAGLLACQHSTLVKVAAKRRTDLRLVAVAGHMHFDAAGDIARIELAFRLAAPAGTRAESVEACLRLTEATCTISRALKVPVHSGYTLVAAPDATASSR